MTKNNPLVSVILPTFNRAYCIERSIKSVINQTYQNWELVIIDNYSSDNTEEKTKNFKNYKIKYFKFKNDGIIAKSRNYGLSKSKGNVIAFLDSDDWWVPKKIELEIKLILKGFDFVYSDMYLNYAKKKGFRKRTRTRTLKKPIFSDLLINGNAINNSSVILKKSYITQIGGFTENKDFVTSEDFYLWLKISKLTNNFIKSKQISGYLTIGGDNATSLKTTTNSMLTIYEYFKQDLIRLNMKPLGLWYTLSRSNYNNTRYKKSIFFAIKVLINSNNNDLRFKSIFTIISSIIRMILK